MFNGPIYMNNEEAKNIFNSLLSRNRHVMNDINLYKTTWQNQQNYKL
jgi:hypothetical protein